MRARASVLGLVLLLGLGALLMRYRDGSQDGASGPAPVVTASASVPTSASADATPTRAVSPAVCWAELAENAAAAVTTLVPGTEVGIAVYDRATRTVVGGVNTDQPFYTASVVKVLIAIDTLHGGAGICRPIRPGTSW